MVAAVDEERVPALPIRGSSREFGQSRSMSSGTKVLMAVLFSVAVLGFGVGVALKRGLFSTSTPSETLATAVHFDQAHPEREKEFLTMKDASEETAKPSARAHAHAQAKREKDESEDTAKASARAHAHAQAKREKDESEDMATAKPHTDHGHQDNDASGGAATAKPRAGHGKRQKDESEDTVTTKPRANHGKRVKDESEDTVTTKPHADVDTRNATSAHHRSMARATTGKKVQEDNKTEARAKIDAYLKLEAQKTANQSKSHNSSQANQSNKRHTTNETVLSNKSNTTNETVLSNKSNTTNETVLSNKSNTTNETVASNKTTSKNGTGEANQTRAHNSTHNGTKKSSHADKIVHHKHLTCKGGSLAACQCLFACKVFGGQPSQCSGSKVDLMDSLIQKALSSAKYACLGMQCIVRCAKSLKCYDDKVKGDCRALATRSSGLDIQKQSKGGSCQYECEDTTEEDFLTQ